MPRFEAVVNVTGNETSAEMGELSVVLNITLVVPGSAEEFEEWAEALVAAIAEFLGVNATAVELVTTVDGEGRLVVRVSVEVAAAVAPRAGAALQSSSWDAFLES